MQRTGDKPGKGVYVCMACGREVVVENDGDKLPVCPQCKGSIFR